MAIHQVIQGTWLLYMHLTRRKTQLTLPYRMRTTCAMRHRGAQFLFTFRTCAAPSSYGHALQRPLPIDGNLAHVCTRLLPRPDSQLGPPTAVRDKQRRSWQLFARTGVVPTDPEEVGFRELGSEQSWIPRTYWQVSEKETGERQYDQVTK